MFEKPCAFPAQKEESPAHMLPPPSSLQLKN
ncbi:hypothetical protein N399_06825 [Bacillus licheniformis CG-B52]|nr:hypothetical protein N399_06825 [Bacillus licheniformis CG-B52]